MTEQEAIKMNGWTFEETVKTVENLMESERNMFKWDVLRHLRDFAELFCEELRQYRAIGTPEECLAAVEKQKEMIAYCNENDCSDCYFHNTNQKYNKCMNDFIADEIVKGGGVDE